MKPSRVTWFLTHRCNLTCDYCATILPEQATPDSTDAELEAITAAVIAVGAEVVILTGGEAAMHPQAQRVVNAFNDAGQEFVLISNATWPRELYGVRNLSCSVDVADVPRRRVFTVNDQEYKSGVGYARLLRHVGEYGPGSATASVTVSRANARRVPHLVHVLAEHDIASMIGVVHTSLPGDPRPWRMRTPVGLGLDQRAAQTVSAELVAMKDAGAPILNDRAYLEMIASHGATLDWHCTTASDLVVDSDGAILTCSDWWGPRCRGLNIVGLDLDAWRAAHAADNAECSGCLWNCSVQAETTSSSLKVGRR